MLNICITSVTHPNENIKVWKPCVLLEMIDYINKKK